MDNSTHRLLSSSARRFWLGIVLGVLIVGAGACDHGLMQMNSENGSAGTGVATSSRSVPADSTVRLLPMTQDQQLLSPEQASKGELDRLGTSDGEGLPTDEEPPSLKSPYGCVLSTPNLQGEASYRYEAVYAFFPDDMVAKTGRRTRHVRFQMASRTAYTEGERSVAHILRKARCRVPDTEQAPKLMRKRLERFPAASEKTIASSDGEPVWSGVPVSEGRSKTRSSTDENEGEWKCVAVTQVCDCAVSRGPGGEIVVSCDCRWICTSKVYVKDPDGGGGNQDDQSGDSPDECTYEGDSSEDLCGGGMPPPDSGDEVNENELCSNDPLKDMDIRATGCKEDGDYSIEGGRYGDTRGPNNNQFHPGIDLLNDVGDPVYAAEGGVVSRVDLQTNDEGGEAGWGYYVIIRTGTLESGDIEWHVYAHLQEEGRINEENEDGGFVTVDEGDVLGYTGTSGNASPDSCSGGPPHLHYEVRQGDSWTASNEPPTVNPENHLGTEFSESTGEAISDCSSN